MDKGKPEYGKQYLLVGGKGKPSIAAGNTWEESEIKKKAEDDEAQAHDEREMFPEDEPVDEQLAYEDRLERQHGPQHG